MFKNLEAVENVLKGSWPELKNRVVVLCFTAYQMSKFHARLGFELLDDDFHSVLLLICPLGELKAPRYL